jgi:hemerythrin-like metal-binding protein
MMAAASYPDLGAHVAEHRKLTDTVEKLNREVKAGTVGLTVELMEFLQNWLRNHIMQVDRKYSPFVKA